MEKIFLTGAPASGKSTLGSRLASRLGRRFVDLDGEIVREAGKAIPDIFAEEGESGFRRREKSALARIVVESPDGCIVALGGGSLLDAENRALCEKVGAVICLDTPGDEELGRRLAAGGRPLGDRSKERAAHYASFARRVAGSFEIGDSLVVVGRGIAQALASGEKAFVADENAARLHAGKIPAPIAIVPSGEENKTPHTVGRLWSAFAANSIGRRDRIAAFGGGVTGDLAGFAAATWMRGIDWVNFPTTLLSMVDASVGGKTGCDLPEGKNLAGAFHPPRLVTIDTCFLETLPAGVLAQGRAEMIKHEIIGNLPHDTPVRGIPEAAEIAGNLRVKADIVREDPFERTGSRILLNCGHTVAHGIELCSGYGISHGEAVAIGCVEEARMAVRMGLAPAGWPEEIEERFRAAGLATAMPEGISRGRLAEAMCADKKRAGGTVVFALPCGWGDVRKVPVDLSKGTMP
ncbi:MAG: bifunctional shikimate kinase/3-dehydroquinate synthase [Kiritimatiellae bacterium]|nr:bifunctional shikimate kinase/3-dehydroquinate synthase [Kiritimatiellia bacterium]